MRKGTAGPNCCTLICMRRMYFWLPVSYESLTNTIPMGGNFFAQSTDPCRDVKWNSAWLRDWGTLCISGEGLDFWDNPPPPLARPMSMDPLRNEESSPHPLSVDPPSRKKNYAPPPPQFEMYTQVKNHECPKLQKKVAKVSSTPPPPLVQAPPCLSTRTRSDRHFYRIF